VVNRQCLRLKLYCIDISENLYYHATRTYFKNIMEIIICKRHKLIYVKEEIEKWRKVSPEKISSIYSEALSNIWDSEIKDFCDYCPICEECQKENKPR